jgi:hypothetical protein
MRKRSEPHTFEQRLVEQRSRLERRLAETPDGPLRDQLVARIEQLRTAAEMHAFLKSGSEPPLRH